MSLLGLAACANQGHMGKSSQSGRNAQGTYLQVKHKALGFEQLQTMARRGDADAQYALGYRYYYGIGVKQDMTKSVSWLKQAGSQGQTQARQALVLIRQANNMDTQSGGTAQAKQSSSTAGTQTGSTMGASGTAASTMVQRGDMSRQASSSGASNGFTLQLMGTHDKQSLVDFIMTNNLQDKATYYRRSFDGQDWYVLVSGRFSTQSEALEAIRRLPENVRSMNPWVKPLGLVKKEMQS